MAQKVATFWTKVGVFSKSTPFDPSKSALFSKVSGVIFPFLARKILDKNSEKNPPGFLVKSRRRSQVTEGHLVDQATAQPFGLLKGQK